MPSISDTFLLVKSVDVAEVHKQLWSEIRQRRLNNNVDQTHLVTASGKVVLQNCLQNGSRKCTYVKSRCKRSK